MSFKNKDARKLLDALEILRDISIDMALERQAIAHKINALLSKERIDMSPAELIADMDDDELGWAISQNDKRLGNIIDPDLFNHLRKHRPLALAIANEIIHRR